MNITHYFAPHFKKRVEGRNVSVGENYHHKCPFCKQDNLFWSCEWERGEINPINKCGHFVGLSDKKEFIFSNGFNIKVDGNDVFLDNKLIYRRGIKNLEYYIDNIIESSNPYYDRTLEKLLLLRGDGSHTERMEFLLDYLKEKKHTETVVENYSI